ncbi:MAG: hypothetical protein KIT46_08925 [Anaerolineales bacterium]|nr:hypothetical protein [Anaerolineales bacterium]MCW5856152.1 hypothetical protein [Anaerolineales bacterium]
MPENEKKDKSQDAMDAASEGMGHAIGGLETSSAEFTDFLDKVIKEFKEESTGATLREAARIVIEREDLEQYTDRVESIHIFLKAFLGGKNTDWSALEEEDTKRRLRDDKTLGGTPG